MSIVQGVDDRGSPPGCEQSECSAIFQISAAVKWSILKVRGVSNTE